MYFFKRLGIFLEKDSQVKSLLDRMTYMINQFQDGFQTCSSLLANMTSVLSHLKDCELSPLLVLLRLEPLKLMNMNGLGSLISVGLL